MLPTLNGEPSPRDSWFRRVLTIAWATTAVALMHSVSFAQERQPLINRLDPKTRGKVILALAGLVLLGLLMIVMTWLIFRIIRRRIRYSQEIADRQRIRSGDDDEWARKPL